MNDLNFTSTDFNFQRDLIMWYEYALVPFYILIIYFINRVVIWKFYSNSPYKKYINPASFLKIIGGVFVCLVYNYYYKEAGDPSAYFNDGNNLSRIILHNPIDGIRILFSKTSSFPKEYDYILSHFRFLETEDTYIIVRFSAIVQLFAFNSFILTSILFGYLSFWAIWQLYLLFVKIYPNYYKPLAYSILFIPSLLAWGSGILKDTVTLASLSLFVVAAYNIMIEKKITVKTVAILLITGMLLLKIKAYILIAIIPSLLFLKVNDILFSVKSTFVKFIITPTLFIGLLVLVFVFVSAIGNMSENKLYDVGNMLAKSKIQREYLYALTKDKGSGYSLGEIGDDPIDLLLHFPAAVNVTFFRPYIWEVRNPIMLMSALESLGFLLITLFCLTKYGFMNSFKIMRGDPVIIFCLSFALIFGFFVGISTYNFGSLVRYKIPALPFFITAMALIYYKKKSLSQI